MRPLVTILSILLLPLIALNASAGPVLDRIKSQGVIRCGAVSRPGVVEAGKSGRARGLLLDLCRAIGAAVLPPEGRLEFSEFDGSKDFDAVRKGTGDLFFLSASEIVEQKLAGKILPGPAVFNQSISVLVPEGSKAHRLADLAGEPVCFALGSNADRSLNDWFGSQHLDLIRMGYQEDVEMYDAYNVHVCHALAGEATLLAKVRLYPGVKNFKSRIVEEPLAAFPIIAATGTADAQWSAIVAWSIHTLMNAGKQKTEWSAGGIGTLPIEAPELGLTKGWQERVVKAAGTYADIYSRNLGEGSIYQLPPGLNGTWRAGGLILPPHVE